MSSTYPTWRRSARRWHASSPNTGRSMPSCPPRATTRWCRSRRSQGSSCTECCACTWAACATSRAACCRRCSSGVPARSSRSRRNLRSAAAMATRTTRRPKARSSDWSAASPSRSPAAASASTRSHRDPPTLPCSLPTRHGAHRNTWQRFPTDGSPGPTRSPKSSVSCCNTDFCVGEVLSPNGGAVI